MRAISFQRFAGLCAVLTALSGALYSVAFIINERDGSDAWRLMEGLFLMLGGLLSTAVLVAIYRRLRETDADFAFWAFLLAIAGAAGAAIHGGYDLANAVNPPASPAPGLPSQIDPRGLLAFGTSGIGIFVIAWLMARGGRFPKGLGYLGYILAVLLVVLYIGRLTVVESSSPVILVPAVLAGFLAHPTWYTWVGLSLWRGREA